MKKLKNKQAKKASKLAKAENMKQHIITVKNAEGDPDTKAEILIQNKIGYTPKVSVIIPVYNVEEYLRECLDSVVNQTLKEIEIICVDDGSTDSSLEILKEYAKKDSRITVITQQNLHAGVARNAGLAIAKGEYVHFLDSDDWIEKETYSKLYVLVSEKKCNIIKFRSFCYDNTKKKIVNSYFTNMGAIGEKYFDKKIIVKDNIEIVVNISDAPWSGMYKTSFIQKNNIKFDNLLCANDTSFYYRCVMANNELYLSSKRFVYYRINNNSSLIGQRVYHFNCQLEQYAIISKIIKNNSQVIMESIKKHLVHAILYRYKMYNEINIPYMVRSKIYKETKDFISSIDENLIPEEYRDVYAKLVSKNPCVSVIIPVYNTEKYLRECLDSVVNQTLQNIEIICINDCSTDNSLQILQEYANKDGRIKIINNEKNLGSAESRNKGILLTTGEYIGFIDSDDYISLDYYDNLMKNAILFNADISATSKAKVFSEEDDSFYKNLGLNNKITISDIADKKDIIITTGVSCNKIYKKSFLKKNNIKCLGLKNAAEDNYFTDCAVIMADKIVVSHDSVYYYRNNAVSQTKKLKDSSQFSMIQVYQEIDNFIKQQNFPKTVEQEWLSIINQRKKNDFNEFMRTMQPDCQEQFRELFHKAFPTIKDKLIISLTSYPARINTVNQTIESLLNQTMKADKVILWLAPEQFPNKEKDLPPQLLDLTQKGLTIDWYHDIKSYKKLIPTLKKYPDAIIVTADDDIIYPPDWLKKLYTPYVSKKNIIWCHRAHRITMEKTSKISKYKQWNHCLKISEPSYRNFCTTGGGVLYPPNSFYKDVLDEKKFMELAPYADDIWFWSMLVLNKKKISIVPQNMSSLNLIQETQVTALWHQNVVNNENDIQIQNVIKEYPEILQLLKKEKRNTIHEAYYKFCWNIMLFLHLKRKIKIFYKQSICRQLKSIRIDIKNFGNAENGTDIATAAKVSHPAWFANEQGQGCVAESCGNTEKLAITCRGAGKLRLEFRGSDKRFDGTRFPLWIDYKSIKINGKEQLTAPVATWHDKPYRFEMPVKDGQVVTVEVVQQYHQYAKDELQDVILKLNPNSDYIRQNINRLTDKIYDKITVKPAAPRAKKPKAASNQELLASIAALNARIERLEQENRDRQAQLLAAINTLKKA